MPFFTALDSYCVLKVLLFVLGHLRDAWRALVGGTAASAPPRGYAPLCKDDEDITRDAGHGRRMRAARQHLPQTFI